MGILSGIANIFKKIQNNIATETPKTTGRILPRGAIFTPIKPTADKQAKTDAINTTKTNKLTLPMANKYAPVHQDYIQSTQIKKPLNAIEYAWDKARENANNSKITGQILPRGSMITNIQPHVTTSLSVKELQSRPDFNQLADKGKNNGSDLLNKYVPLYALSKNPVEYHINEGKKDTLYSGSDKLNYAQSSNIYLQMTDEQRKTYDAYIGIGDKAGASKYFDSIKDELKQKAGKSIVDAVDKDNGLQTTALEYDAGFNSFFTGMNQHIKSKLMSDDTTASPSAQEQAVQAIRPELNGAQGVAADVASAAGFMTPAILVSVLTRGAGIPAVAGEALSAGLFGTAAAGNAYADSLNAGKDQEDARTYAIINGSLEAGLQFVLGGIKPLGGGLISKTVSKTALGKTAASQLDNVVTALSKTPAVQNVFRVMAKQAGSSGEEFIEEWTQAVLDPVVRNVVFDENNKIKPFSPDKLYAGALGALTAGVINSVSIPSAYNEASTKTRNSLFNNYINIANKEGFNSENARQALEAYKSSVSNVQDRNAELTPEQYNKEITNIKKSLKPYGINDVQVNYKLNNQEAVIVGDKIFVSPKINTASALQFKIEHELAHAAYRVDNTLANDTLNVMQQMGMDVDSLIQETTTNYRRFMVEEMGMTAEQAAAEVNEDYAKQEVFADFVGTLAEDVEMRQQLSKANPNLLQRILAYVDALVKRMQGMSVEQIQVQKYQQLATEIRGFISQQTGVKMGEGQFNNVAAGGEKYSLKLGGYNPDTNITTNGILEYFGIQNINSKREVINKIADKLKQTYLSTNEQSKPIMNLDTGMEIEIWKSGINETFGNDMYFFNRSKEYQLAKIAIMPQLAKLIKYGEVRSPEANNLHNINSKIRYAYLISPIKVDGLSYNVTIDIRRSPQGQNRFYIHDLKLNKIDGISRALISKEKVQYEKKMPSTNTTLSQSDNGVNNILFKNNQNDTQKWSISETQDEMRRQFQKTAYSHSEADRLYEMISHTAKTYTQNVTGQWQVGDEIIFPLTIFNKKTPIDLVDVRGTVVDKNNEWCLINEDNGKTNKYKIDTVNKYGVFAKPRENNTVGDNKLRLPGNNKTIGNQGKRFFLPTVNEVKAAKPNIAKMTPAKIASISYKDANTTPEFPRTEALSKGDKQSHLYQNALDSKLVSGDIKETKSYIKDWDDVKYYHGIANTYTLNKAYSQLNSKGESEVYRFLNITPENATVNDVAEGFILLKQYQDAYNYEAAAEIVKKMRQIGTASGQAVQIFSLMGRMTPEGMTMYAQKELDSVRKEMIKKRGEAWVNDHKDIFELSPDEMAFIKDNMEKASQLPEGRDKNILLAEISSLIEDKLPTSILRQIKALARNSMLLNPKTMIRNIVGNAIMMPAYVTQDFIGSGFDKALSAKTGIRTKGITLPNKSSLRAAKKGVYESYDDFRRGINTKQISGDRFEIGRGNDFRHYEKEEIIAASGVKKASMKLSNKLNKIDRLTGFLLDAGDRPFFEYHFTNSLNNQLRLNNATEPTAEMVDIATNEAMQRTWQDNNGLTKAVTGIRDMMNGNKEWGLGSIIMPFAKTPANLVKALVDYSPAGLVKAIASDAVVYNRSLKSLTFDIRTQKKFVDSLSKGITGTLVMAIAAALYQQGLLSAGDDDDDKDYASYRKNVMGIKPYSVILNGQSYPYDWAQPVGGMFAITADFMKNLKNGNEPTVQGLDMGGAGNAILNALFAGGNVLFEQSFLQGISELFSSDGLMQGLVSTLLQTPTQFVPTALSQIAQIADPTARTSYEQGDPIGTLINRVLAKIPGAKNKLAPVVDPLGHDVATYGNDVNPIARYFDIFLNPANVYTNKTTAAAQEINGVYNETGDATVIPKVAPYYMDYQDNRYNFSTEERSQYQRTTGQTNEKIVSDLMGMSAYNNLSDEEKAQVLKAVVDYSAYSGKMEYLNSKGAEYASNDWMDKVADSDVSAATFIFSHYATKDMETKAERADYWANSTLSDSDKYALYKSDKDGKDDAGIDAATNAGISSTIYLKFISSTSGLTSDKDASGGTITNSLKKKVLNQINALPLSSEQKDVLYLTRYKISTIDDAPWHGGTVSTYSGGLSNFNQQSTTVSSSNNTNNAPSSGLVNWNNR